MKRCVCSFLAGTLPSLPLDYIHKTPVYKLMSVICGACEKPITKDLKSLRTYYARLKRYDWDVKMQQWAGKHRRVRKDTRPVELKSDVLIQSLLHARDSFATPLSVNPKALCPTTQPESTAPLLGLVRVLELQCTLAALTPKQIYHQFENLASKLLRENFGGDSGEELLGYVLTPGFERFMRKWLRRAVNHAVASQADEEDKDGKDDDDVQESMEKMQKTKIDSLAQAVENDFEELLGKSGKIAVTDTFDEQDDEQDAGDDDEKL